MLEVCVSLFAYVYICTLIAQLFIYSIYLLYLSSILLLFVITYTAPFMHKCYAVLTPTT